MPFQLNFYPRFEVPILGCKLKVSSAKFLNCLHTSFWDAVGGLGLVLRVTAICEGALYPTANAECVNDPKISRSPL